MSTTDTPDLTPLLRQRLLDAVILDLLAESTWDDTVEGVDYSMQVEDTSGGVVKASLWVVDPEAASIEVAQVVLDFTATPTTGGASA